MKVYNRNIANKEKKVDIELEACILEWALDYDWKVEVWFWLLGMFADLEKSFFFTTWITFIDIFHMCIGKIPQEKTISLK